jgi:hypothetical protein
MEIEAKRPKLLIEKVNYPKLVIFFFKICHFLSRFLFQIEILDESTGQIILKEKTRYVYSKNDCDNDTDNVNMKFKY